MSRSRRDLYVEAFRYSYRRGRTNTKEQIEVRWLKDRTTRATVWRYQGEVIACLIMKGPHWLYLRAGNPKSTAIFDRFDRIVRQYNLGVFIKIKQKKRWVFIPQKSQHFNPWSGQLLFKLNEGANEAGSLPSLSERIQAILPINFTHEPQWEKDILWSHEAVP
jgi:hypothetical protein